MMGTATAVKHETDAPPEKLCTLNIHGNLTVVGIDGKTVHWTPNFGDAWVSVRIPEGSHTFLVNYGRDLTASHGETHYKNNIEYTYAHFVAGHTYQMLAGEGAEPRGFLGMFDDIVGTMKDSAQRKVTVVVQDVTEQK